MKKIVKIAAALLVVLTTSTAIAQNLPKPSPKAKVEQRIGLTDVTVEYSRPSAKGRTIFGDLVAYDQLWRTGANMNTLVTFTDHVKIEGQAVEAGTYSLFTIPSAKNKKWTVILNSVTDGWGTGKYDSTNNVASFMVAPQTIAKVETMRFTFENITDNTSDLVLAWADQSVSLTIEVEVESKAWEYIDVAIREASGENAASVYRNCAKYAVTTNKRLKDGLKWINLSIDKDKSWYSYWVKADVQYAMGDNEGAVASAKQAIELGEVAAKEKGKPFKYRAQIEKAMAEYK